jgi:hypothetical protein
VFREYGFPAEHSDTDLGRTAQTWAQIMDRLVSYSQPRACRGTQANWR